MAKNRITYIWIINAIEALKEKDGFLGPNEMAELNNKLKLIKNKKGERYQQSLHDNLQTVLDRVSELEDGNHPQKYDKVNGEYYTFFIKEKPLTGKLGKTKYKLHPNWKKELDRLKINNPDLNDKDAYFSSKTKNFGAK